MLLSLVLYLLSLLQAMPLKLNIVDDITYPQQDRQSGSKVLEQIAGMGGQGWGMEYCTIGYVMSGYFKPSTELYND